MRCIAIAAITLGTVGLVLPLILGAIFVRRMSRA